MATERPIRTILAAALALGGATPKILLTVAFIFITAPSAAHLVGRAAYRAEGIEFDVDGRDELAEMLAESDDGVEAADDDEAS